MAPNGLTHSMARALYHFCRFKAISGKKAVTRNTMMELLKEELSLDDRLKLEGPRLQGSRTPELDNKNYVTPGVLARAVADLGKSRWAGGTSGKVFPPYLQRVSDGFFIEGEYIITSPAAAKILLLLCTWSLTDTRSERSLDNFVDYCREATSERAEKIRQRVEWLSTHEYIVREVEDDQSIDPGTRVNFERPYIELLAEGYQTTGPQYDQQNSEAVDQRVSLISKSLALTSSKSSPMEGSVERYSRRRSNALSRDAKATSAPLGKTPDIWTGAFKLQKPHPNSDDNIYQFAEDLHSYHLTSRDGKPIWIYNVLPFRRGSVPGTLVARGFNMPAEGELKRNHRNQYVAFMFGTHFILTAQRVGGPSDTSIELFPHFGRDKFPIAGGSLLTVWGSGKPAFAKSILNDKPLPYAIGAKIGLPVSDDITAKLEIDWQTRSEWLSL